MGLFEPKWHKNSTLVCHACNSDGSVQYRRVERKVGVSGGKATGAILTGGLSLLATGLSKKVKVTEYRCGRCSQTWMVQI